MLNDLALRSLRMWMYEDIDRLAEDIRNAPRDVKLIKQVSFQADVRDGESAGSTVALSAVPLRLAGQRGLKNVDTLELGDLRLAHCGIETHFHSYSCPLYGRAFPNVVRIQLNAFQFPSFIDFAFFVTSFPALTTLQLESISCKNQVISPSVARGPKKRDLRLKALQVHGHSGKEKWFAQTFLYWFLRRCSRFPEMIDFDEPMFDHSWGREVLRNCSGVLRELTISLDSKVRQSQGDFTRESWLGK